MISILGVIMSDMPKPFAARIVVVLVLMLGSLAWAADRPKRGEVTKAAVNYTSLRAGTKAFAAVVVEIKEGLHAQSHTPLDELYIKYVVKPDANPSMAFGEPKYPPGQVENYPALGKLSVYTGRVVTFIPLTVKADAKLGPIELTGKVTFQACDAKVCYPPESPKFSIKTEIVAADAPVKPNEPELFKEVASGASESSIANTTPTGSVKVTGARLDTGIVATNFAFAFLVGIIFNLMPCVLPVLPLKAMGFYEASQHSRGKSVAFGATFSLGLVATFAVFGILIFGYHAFDWGQLFTKWWFTLAIVLILLGMAAQTFGAFSVGVPRALYRVSPRHDTYWGNFLLGIFTALLSTPCTFGMFVGLLAWAIALNSPLLGIMMLWMVGLGMAFPYLMLSAFPEAARRFPRSGPWGELVKQMMGFLLLLAAVYFARPFIGRVVGGETFWWLPFGVVVIAAIFLIVRTFQFARTSMPRLVSVAISLALVIGALLAVRRLTFTPYQWRAYSTAALDDARKSNRIAVVEFTADWCGNCQYVEAKVLHSRDIVDAVHKRDIAMLKADVTRDDAPARPLLEQLNPAGSIPLTVIYPPGGAEPIELTGIYTASDLLRALDSATRAETRAVAVRG